MGTTVQVGTKIQYYKLGGKIGGRRQFDQIYDHTSFVISRL
jgi:hypothetical protein